MGFYDDTGNSQGLAILDRFIFVVERAAGFRVIDADDITGPVECGISDTDPIAWHVALDDSGLYAYVTDREDGLRVFDLRPCGLIFIDGFETGDTSRWSATVQ